MEVDPGDNSVGAGDNYSQDSKPDPSKLAHSAIIKQDVMLSGTSTQSPVSSVLTMPAVSMPQGATSLGGIASSTGGLPDNLFLGMSGVTANDVPDTKTELSGILSSPSGPLLGQPQVAATPAQQFILTAPNAQAAPQLQQQILIPVSAANGGQQLLSIPLSLATQAAASSGAGNAGQIQLLTTANGQILATNLANLAAAAGNQQTIGLAALPHGNSGSNQVVASSQQAVTMAQSAAPQLVVNAQGQIMALGTPQQLLQQQQITLTAAANNTLTSSNHNTSLTTTAASLNNPAAAAAAAILAASNQSSANTVVSSASAASIAAASQIAALQVAQVSHSGSSGNSSVVVGAGGSPSNASGVVSPFSTPNINQLLPNTISSAGDGTVVDGVNLDEIREFAKAFKIRRLSLGLTQTQVGQALSATEGPSYSQSAICRFEKLDITPKSAQKMKPVLERWIAEAEERYKNGVQNLSDFVGSEPLKKRKRRTSFTPQALEILNEHFEKNTHPTGAEMTDIADVIAQDREVIRVWFCNRRQALKNTIKRLRSN
uniref:POU domain protein n=1 Tax=Malacoceros fuliginosus TaxID=271776 RepID=A0A7G9UKY8_MALFL|nr:POU domain class 6 transcription factor [Malacoceros fuliginosus]